MTPPVGENAHSDQVIPGLSIKGLPTARANAAEGDPAEGLELAFHLREVELEWRQADELLHLCFRAAELDRWPAPQAETSGMDTSFIPSHFRYVWYKHRCVGSSFQRGQN